MQRVRASRVLLTSILLLAVPFFAHAALRTATADDCKKLTAEGVACITGKTLFNPDDRSTGDEVAIATQFLLERNGTGTRDTGCYTSQSDRITKLNPQFRVSLYKALTEIEKQYGGKNIIQSGYRCAGGAHNKGCAADIIWASCRTNPKPSLNGRGTGPWECASDRFDAPEQKWIIANGKSAPYNIHLPYQYYPEGHHVEPVNTQGCVTNSTVTSSNTPPSAPLTNAIRQALGLPQQPQLAQPQLPQQPLPQQQSPLTAFQTSGTNDVGTNISSPILSDAPITAPGGNAATILEQLAFGTTSTTTVATSTFSVVVSGQNAAQLTSTQQPQQTNASTTIQSGVISQQTFVSPDLASQTTITNQSRAQQILAALKEVLLRMLQYLRPFGSRASNDYDYEY